MLVDDDGNAVVPNQGMKQSQTFGKVFLNFFWNEIHSNNTRQTQNKFLEEYISQWHSILIELLQQESITLKTTCVCCQQSLGTHWCKDCFSSNIWYDDCCFSSHKPSFPLCSDVEWAVLPEIWFSPGETYNTSPNSCFSILLNVEVDNPSDLDIFDEEDDHVNQSEPTYTQESGTNFWSKSKLIIVSSTGIFRHSFWRCHHVKLLDECIQHFIHARLFQASFKNPQTLFMFKVLDHFQVDSLECKMAAMNFMSKIGQITDAFPSLVPVSYMTICIGILFE